MIALLFTDIEGSTPLGEKHPADFGAALQQHHRMVREALGKHGGVEFSETGDGFCAAFEDPSAALQCAVAIQRALAAEAWPETIGSLRVRVALHAGDAEFRDGQYRGPAMNRAARALSATHGGQILCTGAFASLVPESSLADLALTDLGQFRLRGLSAPEQLFQVDFRGMPCAAFPPPNAIRPLPENLPAQLNCFVGREAEVAAIAALLQPATGKERLVTLTGPGGTGKTRVSIAVAMRLAEESASPVTFVPLADLSDAGALAETIRSALRLPHVPALAPLDQIAEHLDAHRALLVLDNFEQLASEGSGIILRLLDRAPRSRFLITSRQRLAVPPEREFHIAPLPTPGDDHTLRRLEANASVQLFLERARGIRTGFDLSEENAASVAALCNLLEGIPLAIELAAAGMHALGTGELLDQLKKRLDLPPDLASARPERHRTLGAAIDWSYDSLLPDQQRFFAALGTFRGGWSADAAALVAEVPRNVAVNFLYHLRSCSLIHAQEGAGTMRYGMLETIRQYAEALLQDELPAARKRLSDFLASWLDEARRHFGQPDEPEWMDRIETEHDNLRTALTFLREANRPRYLRTVSALYHFWYSRGHLREGIQWLQESEKSSPETQAEAAARCNLGILYWSNGRLADACISYESALGYARGQGNSHDVAGILNNLAILLLEQDEPAAAIPRFEEALELFESLSMDRMIATLRENLAVAHFHVGEYDRAEALLPPEDTDADLSTELTARISVLDLRARIAYARRRHREAQHRIVTTLELVTRINFLPASHPLLTLAAALAAQCGHAREGARLLGAADGLRARLGDVTTPLHSRERETALRLIRPGLDADELAALLSAGALLDVKDATALLANIPIEGCAETC